MDNLVQMSTTGRHNKFIGTLVSRIFPLVENNEASIFHEQYSIVYYGSRRKTSDYHCLVDIAEIDDINKFLDRTIYELDFIQPDFVVFKDNKYITDSRDLRTAGQPDLIVEVWSDGNTKSDKIFLRNLYATSEKTEFWQIEQNSNTVECSLGAIKLSEQSLKNILKTQKGLEFDLRYLAIEN
jgi:hypothetical protein